MFRAFSILTVLSCASIFLHAEVVMAPLFTNNAVLQQGKPIPVWGAANPGEKVTVAFGNDTASAVTGSDGRWKVALKPLAATETPADLIVTGDNKIVLQNIVVGEVWLASGQSNMAFVLSRGNNAAQENAEADFPFIRHFTVPHINTPKPLEPGKTGTWPANSGNPAWSAARPGGVANFSAVGYFFARNLYRKLKVPIGIINSSWGDTTIEAWLDPGTLAGDGTAQQISEQWEKTLADIPKMKEKSAADLAAWTTEEAAAKEKGEAFTKPKPRPYWVPGPHRIPFGLYNAMIHPLIPYAIRGVIWYQGEANSRKPAEYRKFFPALIGGWRQVFGQGNFPFYWVQLANHDIDDPTEQVWAFFREVQDQTLSVPHTGQALTIDIGDAKDIHPKNKQEVGRRLALIALAKDYSQKVEFDNPRFASAKIEGGSIRVTFNHLEGLNIRGDQKPSLEVAGKDKNFVPAAGKIENNVLIVSSPSVSSPVAVRYGWRNNPVANLYNGSGLPVVPFRSDTW